jgi:RNA polymerase sigma-70 factor (ECF subfamily)
MSTSSAHLVQLSDSDAELARRIVRDDEAAFDLLMRRHNRDLFRVARAILKDDADAEDVLQEAYLAAYRHMAGFRAEAKLSTWLTRIVINQALMRRRSRHHDRNVVQWRNRLVDERASDALDRIADRGETPEQSILRADIRRLLERTIDELPVEYRMVFVLRDVQGRSVGETAACLCIPAATVRSRTFRARGILRETLTRDFDIVVGDLFDLGGERCDRVVTGVLRHRRTLALTRESGKGLLLSGQTDERWCTRSS